MRAHTASMPTAPSSASGRPATVTLEIQKAVALIHIERPEKRNALDDDTVLALERLFIDLPAEVRAVVLTGRGEHFSAGLDLSALGETDTFGGVAHSMMWHRAFRAIQYGRVPVVAALKGAVIGGGLELAAACHIRVAEPSAFFALPEGQRGLFVGGGGSVRIPRLIGVAAMTDMMLTGRVLDAEEGNKAGLAQYLVGEGEGLGKALALAERIAGNAPVSNFAVLQALPRIAESAPEAGYMMESMIAAIAQGGEDAKERMRAFLEKKAGKVRG